MLDKFIDPEAEWRTGIPVLSPAPSFTVFCPLQESRAAR